MKSVPQLKSLSVDVGHFLFDLDLVSVAWAQIWAVQLQSAFEVSSKDMSIS